MGGDKQQGLATLCATPPADISGIVSTVPTPAPVLTFTPPVLNKFSALDSPPPPHLPPLPNGELLSIRSGISTKDPSDNATLPRLRTHMLVDNGNMCLANAVLQLLVYCPPFRDLFGDLGRLVGQREGGEETGGSVTPLIDASVKFLDEFTYKETPPVADQFLQQSGASKVEGEKDDNGVHSFLSTDVYDAMKEKKQFIFMRDGRQLDPAVLLGLYLEALDEELATPRSLINTDKLASTMKVEELKEEILSGKGHTEMVEQYYTANSVVSPILCLFSGRSRCTVRAPNQLDAITIKDWRSLSLNIHPGSVHTILGALTHSSEPQPVLVGQSGSSEATQQVQIESFPTILVLHLERFLYDATADGMVKVGKAIRFVPEVEIPLEIMAPNTGKPAEPVHYKLHGVLYHHGESAGSGNYTVDLLHPNGDDARGDAWLRIDDETVRVVRHEDVFEYHDNEQGDERCAYMLFYCHTASAPT